MELCTSRALSDLLLHRPFFSSNQTHLPWKTCLPLTFKQTSPNFRSNLGLQYYTNSSLRSTTSEETSSGASEYVKEEPDRVITIEKNEYGESAQQEVPTEDSPVEGQIRLIEFLDKLDIKFDSEDSYSILFFGGVAVVALWLLTAIVGAIDSIPLFPKLLEVVGLGYTLWFSTRYLLFKKNREELAAKIDGIKQQVLGLNDD